MTEERHRTGQLVLTDLDMVSAASGDGWRLFTDRVMGGVSAGTLRRETVAGRPALRMQGEVSLDNNGGFVQMALDLTSDGEPLDARAFAGVELDIWGNRERYGCHLRTTAMARPWQSYRQEFVTTGDWQTLRLPFQGFAAHRFDGPLDLQQLRRIGLVAIGRAFHADLALARAALYRE